MEIELPIKFYDWSIDHHIDLGWHYWHDNHDGSKDGNYNLHGSRNSLEECLESIIEFEKDSTVVNLY